MTGTVHEVPGYGYYKPNDSWLRSLARNAGFYRYPHEHENDELTELELNDKFEKLVKSDNPNSACNSLLIEEFRCLNKHNFHEVSIEASYGYSFMKLLQEPELASTKCVKWYNEWFQCKWDEHKMKFGYNYIEPRPSSKHRAYIAAPNYQYS